MKIKEIRESSLEELNARKRELRESAFQLRLQQKLGQLEKPSQIKEVRREIARIETILNERSAQETSQA